MRDGEGGRELAENIGKQWAKWKDCLVMSQDS